MVSHNICFRGEIRQLISKAMMKTKVVSPESVFIHLHCIVITVVFFRQLSDLLASIPRGTHMDGIC